MPNATAHNSLTPPLHKPHWIQTKTMWNDWENFTVHRASSKSHASSVPTQSPLQPTWCRLLAERDPKELSWLQHFADLLSLPNRTWPVTAVNIQARCQVFLSSCSPTYKCFLQLSLLKTSIFLICSEISSSLQNKKSKGFPSFSSTAWLSHSVTVESKNQDHETCVQQNRLVCHKMWKYTTKVCSDNSCVQLKQIALWSFLMAFLNFYFTDISKSSKTNTGINSFHQKVFSQLI